MMAMQRVMAMVVILAGVGNFINPTSAQALDSWKVVVQNAGVEAMHMVTLPTDKVVIFDRTNDGPSNITYQNGICRNNSLDLVLKYDCWAHSVEYNPNGDTIRTLLIFSDPFCSSGAVLPNGTLLQTGGDFEGARTIRTIGGGPTDDWVESTKLLSARRWYATDQLLPDGRVIVIGGTMQNSYEFVPSSGKAIGLPFLAKAYDPQGQNNIYPFVHLCPDGNLFIFSNIYSILFNYKTNAVVKTFPNFGPDPRVYPYSGTSVMLPLTAALNFNKVEIMICGGAPLGSYMQAKLRNYLPALNTCGRIVITDPAPRWGVERMPGPRCMGDGKILPTGEILIINGVQSGLSGWNQNRNPALAPFLYDPVARKWSVQTPTTIARVYHSSANVQSDGTILVGGGNDQSSYVFTGVMFPTELRLEKYSPYYLNAAYDAVRFTITGVPATVGLNTNFVITFTSPAAGTPVVQISLYAPPYTTHANSMGQRMVILKVGPVTRAAGGAWQVTATAPPSGTITPPTYYMLTALNKGSTPPIPSKAKWVRIF
jgi:hypothetical protein